MKFFYFLSHPPPPKLLTCKLLHHVELDGTESHCAGLAGYRRQRVAADGRVARRPPVRPGPRRAVRRLGEAQMGHQLRVHGVLRLRLRARVLDHLGLQGRLRLSNAAIRRYVLSKLNRDRHAENL